MTSWFSFFRPTIVMFHPGAPKPWLLLSYKRKGLTVKTSMFYLQSFILSGTCCSKNAEAAKISHSLPLVSVF
jgi:hypothetical protein